MNEFINEKVLPPVLKFVNTKPIAALRNGMLVSMPFTIVGSFFLILANFPLPSVAHWIANNGWDVYFNQAYGASFGIMSFFAVVGIAYAYAYVKNEGYEALSAGMIGLILFILTMTSQATDAESGVTIGNLIDKTWSGGQGMISAIIIGLITGIVYSWFLRHDIRIKLPESVPENVANSFTALIPAAALICGGTAVFVFFDKVFEKTLV